MIPNIVRGNRMSGLMTYLIGPGRSNEHTDPHLIGGDPALLAWYDDDELNRDSALSIARHLDRPYKVYDTQVSGGHVWHCSLSLRADEGMLSDDQWNQIANDFVCAMGFDDPNSPKAPCRWVAIRHGISKNGNDHIHIAVNLVREDGTKASIHKDFNHAQSAARALEVKYGLEQLESAKAERATRGYNPAEREAQARARARAKYERTRSKLGKYAPTWEALTDADRQTRIASELRTDQPRYLLALKVRAASTASNSEAEFVRRLRRSGILVRPRYADGRTDVITGYSVAERPQAGERPIWYGGGRLGRDLTLPRLRDGWSDTVTGASEAADEWNAAKRGRRVVSPGREASEPDPELWDKRNAELRQIVDRLRTIPVDDRDTWATIARQTAGALAAWSNATEETPGDLAAAADALSRSAQTYRRTVKPQKIGTVALSGVAMLLASTAHGGQGAVAQAVMIRQLLRLTQAVYDASMAAGQVRQAQLLAEDTRVRLVRVRNSMSNLTTVHERNDTANTMMTRWTDLDPEAKAMLERIQAGQAKSATEIASPIPNKIKPAQPRQSSTATTYHGSEL